VEVKGKVVLVRVDFNSPVDPKTKKVLDDARIRAHGASTVKELAEKGAKVVVLAHQGRKGEPDFIPLKQHAELLAKILNRPVKYVDDVYGSRAKEATKGLRSGEILVLENVRTFPLETSEGKPDDLANTELVRSLAPLADLFVLDAFAAAHRAHASIIGFTAVLPSAAGRVMEKELKALSRVLDAPPKPSLFILGGAKADDSLEISKYVLGHKIADHVLTGGVVAQVFLVANGHDLGKQNMAFLEKKGLMALVPGIRELVHKYPDQISTPDDVAVVVDGKRRELPVSSLPTPYSIEDIGEKTIEKYGRLIEGAKSIVFSGPMGVYEKEEAAMGTRKIFERIASSKAFSVAGGGHTISALHELGLSRKISYVSTAGGALTEFLMGKKLPGVAALEAAAARPHHS
jgi:phosphoglycerate kinase